MHWIHWTRICWIRIHWTQIRWIRICWTQMYLVWNWIIVEFLPITAIEMPFKPKVFGRQMNGTSRHHDIICQMIQQSETLFRADNIWHTKWKTLIQSKWEIRFTNHKTSKNIKINWWTLLNISESNIWLSHSSCSLRIAAVEKKKKEKLISIETRKSVYISNGKHLSRRHCAGVKTGKVLCSIRTVDNNACAAEYKTISTNGLLFSFCFFNKTISKRSAQMCRQDATTIHRTFLDQLNGFHCK